jgi:hypothetical protein
MNLYRVYYREGMFKMVKVVRAKNALEAKLSVPRAYWVTRFERGLDAFSREV